MINIEIWKDISSFEGKYQISNKGNIKSLARINEQGRQMPERILKPSKDKDGYLRIGLSKGSRKDYAYFRINRLVAEHFIPNPLSLPQVNHEDGNRNNNEVNNLKWCNNSYNQWHRCHVNNNPPNNDYKKKKVKVILLDEKILVFDSIEETANYFKCTSSAIKNKLYNRVSNPSFRRKTDPLYGVKFEFSEV